MIFLADGHVAARGRFDALLAASPAFATLWGEAD